MIFGMLLTSSNYNDTEEKVSTRKLRHATRTVPPARCGTAAVGNQEDKVGSQQAREHKHPC
jgi:hypothetical protein